MSDNEESFFDVDSIGSLRLSDSDLDETRSSDSEVEDEIDDSVFTKPAWNYTLRL